jgi:hypothetical protein
MNAVPYVPDTVAILPASGTLDLDLRVKTIKPPDSPLRVTIAGDVGLTNLAVARRGETTPFVRVPTLKVAIKEARPLEGLITLAALEVDGLDLKGVRDKQGQIDLLALAKPPASPGTTSAPTPAASKATSAKAPAPPAAATTTAGAGPPATPTTTLKLAVERFALTHGLVTLRDEGVSPVTMLPVKDITATVTNFTWPDTAPLGLDVSLALPTAGKVTVKGSARLTPFSTDVTSSLRGGAIEPYYPYIPFKGRLAGRFNGDSRTQVAIDPQGKLTAASKGTSWIENLEVHNPTDNSVPLKLERFELAGIDFAWPKYARVATITIKKPNGRIERDANGAIRLKELLAVSEPPATEDAAKLAPEPAKPAPSPKESKESKPKDAKDAPVPADVKAAGGAVGFPLDIGAFVIDDGYLQFLDRTVQPAFSETISRLAVRIEGLSSTPGKRAKLSSQAIVGGNAALDIKGELAPLGELYADITGELRDFTLASVNPYADSFVAWVVDRGKLGVRFHYRVERGQLDASNEIFVDDIHVAPTRQDDEVKKKVGLPLGLIVALITDANNDLKINLPMSGPLDKWKADLSDAIWTVVKNVVVNIVAAPFRAIGRLFKGNDDKIESLGVDPVVFAPGVDTLAPGMDEHLVKVADFLRRAPAIKLTLTPVVVPADVDNLKGQELTARIQARQREAKLADFAAAVAAEYKARFAPPAADGPGRAAATPASAPPATSAPATTPPATSPVPATPPANAQPPLPSPDEQLAKLRELEPVPEEKVTELRARRLAVVREGLMKDQGIPEGRLTPEAEAAAPATPATGDGRVEFKIGQ